MTNFEKKNNLESLYHQGDPSNNSLSSTYEQKKVCPSGIK